MSVEESSHCYLAAAEVVCDLLEGELLAGLALEEQRAVFRVAGMLARLDDSGYSRVQSYIEIYYTGCRDTHVESYEIHLD